MTMAVNAGLIASAPALHRHASAKPVINAFTRPASTYGARLADSDMPGRCNPERCQPFDRGASEAETPGTGLILELQR